MPNMKLTSYFQRAVLMALALPAGCTGHVSETEPPTIHPPASCNLMPDTTFTCSWSFTFSGDPATCVGFSGAGTAAECRAACGTNDAGEAPTFCNAFVGEI